MRTPPTAIQLMQPALLHPFVRAMDDQGIDVNPLLQAAGLTREAITLNEGLVSALHVHQLLAAAAIAARDPFFSWNVGWDMDHSNYPLASGILERGVSLGQLFTQMAILSTSHATATRFDLHIEGTYSRFCSMRLYKCEPAPDVDAFGCGMLASLLRVFLGKDWKPSQVSLTLADPKLIPASTHCRRIASAKHTEVSVRFPTKWLLKQYKLNNQQEASKIATISHEHKLQQHLKTTLHAHISKSELSADSAAQYCGGSLYAINKQLKREGTSLNKLINELRCEVARELLRNTSDSVASIGTAVGYPDPTSFSRVFQRWTDTSPRDYKKKMS